MREKGSRWDSDGHIIMIGSIYKTNGHIQSLDYKIQK